MLAHHQVKLLIFTQAKVKSKANQILDDISENYNVDILILPDGERAKDFNSVVNSIKFLSEKVISDVGTEEFKRKDLNQINNLFIKELLSFKGVDLVLLSKNFLSVKKNKEVSWDVLKPMVISHINHYYEKNNKIFDIRFSLQRCFA